MLSLRCLSLIFCILGQHNWRCSLKNDDYFFFFFWQRRSYKTSHWNVPLFRFFLCFSREMNIFCSSNSIWYKNIGKGILHQIKSRYFKIYFHLVFYSFNWNKLNVKSIWLSNYIDWREWVQIFKSVNSKSPYFNKPQANNVIYYKIVKTKLSVQSGN